MRRIKIKLPALIAAILLGSLVAGWSVFVAAADKANTPSLIISQLKITSSNGQFVTLYNPTSATVDMSKYQLQYFNNYDLNKATSSKLIALSGTVPPYGYYMVNDSALVLCYQLTINSLSLGLSSTAGMVEIVSLNQPSQGGPVVSKVEDYVAWSKTAVNGVQTLPASTAAFLRRLPLDDSYNPTLETPGDGTWQSVQPAADNACNLVTAGSSSMAVQTGLTALLPASEPPATFDMSEGEKPVSMLTANIGLMAPTITELLPNPDGTGNDSTNEYIELYNSNKTNFDLSGFSLQSGTTTLRNYVFPAGTILPAQTHKAFYSEQTSLALSNTSGQVKLLDPTGNSLSATEPYVSAKDGQTWALAKGKWYWTTSPTPNLANVIKLPPAKKAKTSASKSKSSKAGTKTSTTKTTSKASATLPGAIEEEPSVTPIHNRMLALVAGLALLYGAYEYRADIANRIYQLRRYLITRQANRQ